MIRVAALVSPNFMPKISATRSNRARPTRPQLSAPITARAPTMRRTVDVTTFFSLKLLLAGLIAPGDRLGIGAVDVAPPFAGFTAAPFDHLLEPLEVAGSTPMHESQRVADLGNGVIGFHLELEHQPGVVGVEPMERDDAGVLGPGGRGPGDALVRMLLGDLGVPLAADSGDLGDPVQALVVLLADLLHAFHEGRELLELRPLVVGGGDRYVDFDGFFDD